MSPEMTHSISSTISSSVLRRMPQASAFIVILIPYERTVNVQHFVLV